MIPMTFSKDWKTELSDFQSNLKPIYFSVIFYLKVGTFSYSNSPCGQSSRPQSDRKKKESLQE